MLQTFIITTLVIGAAFFAVLVFLMYAASKEIERQKAEAYYKYWEPRIREIDENPEYIPPEIRWPHLFEDTKDKLCKDFINRPHKNN
jgi:hypothetical protein